MSQMEIKNPVETAKVLGSIYGSLVILLAVLLFLSAPYFATLPSYATIRSFWLIWIVGCAIVLIGAEIAWQLKTTGMTLISFFGFLILNLFLVIISLAVFADLVVPTAQDQPIQLVLLLLGVAVFGYIIITLTIINESRNRTE